MLCCRYIYSSNKKKVNVKVIWWSNDLYLRYMTSVLAPALTLHSSIKCCNSAPNWDHCNKRQQAACTAVSERIPPLCSFWHQSPVWIGSLWGCVMSSARLAFSGRNQWDLNAAANHTDPFSFFTPEPILGAATGKPEAFTESIIWHH